MALFYAGEYFTPEEKARNFAFYERLTVRDSSLSACIQAAVAAEVGHIELAYDYFAEAALLDLDDLQHNTRDGIHIASLAGGLHRRDRRLRRAARPRREAQLRAPPPAGAHSPGAQPPRSRDDAAEDRGRADSGHLHAANGRTARHPPPRGADHSDRRRSQCNARSRQQPSSSPRPSRAAASRDAGARRPGGHNGVCPTSPSPGSRSSPICPSSPGPRSEYRTDCSSTNAARPLPTSSAPATWPISCTVGRTRQVEHCNNGQKQGRAVARSMLGSTGRSLDWPFGASRCPRRPGSSWRMPAPSRTPPLTRIGSSGPTPTRPGARAAKSSRFQPRPTAPAIDFCPRTATTKSGLTFCVSIDGQGVVLMIETRPPRPDNILYWRTVLA